MSNDKVKFFVLLPSEFDIRYSIFCGLPASGGFAFEDLRATYQYRNPALFKSRKSHALFLLIFGRTGAKRNYSFRLLKNAHLRRCPRPSSLRRTGMYDSLLGVSGALYLSVFEQPPWGLFQLPVGTYEQIQKNQKSSR